MHIKDIWVTFEYDEYGNVKEKKPFKTEDKACNDMYKRLKYLVEWRKKYNIK